MFYSIIRYSVHASPSPINNKYRYLVKSTDHTCSANNKDEEEAHQLADFWDAPIYNTASNTNSNSNDMNMPLSSAININDNNNNSNNTNNNGLEQLMTRPPSSSSNINIMNTDNNNTYQLQVPSIDNNDYFIPHTPSSATSVKPVPEPTHQPSTISTSISVNSIQSPTIGVSNLSNPSSPTYVPRTISSRLFVSITDNDNNGNDKDDGTLLFKSCKVTETETTTKEDEEVKNILNPNEK